MTNNRVAVLQSSYIPWKGYFDIIHDVDTFIFYDDVQFTKSDWRSRNRVKTIQGPRWLSIPAGSDQSRLIHEVELSDPSWQRKHWATLKQSYGKSRFFPDYRSFFEDVYLGTTWTSLSKLNQYLITHIANDFLGITTTFYDSRRYAAQGQKLDRLLDLLQKVGATSYVSGPAASDYIDASRFASAGIGLQFKDYSDYPEYRQPYPPFDHAVSILDLLFAEGGNAGKFIWGWRDDG